MGVLYYGERYYWMNCGDSRLYRLRDGQLTQLTVDHSLTKNDGSQRHSNVITNCIGAGFKDSYIDFYEFTNDVLPGDTYLLCSDGLNDMVSNHDATMGISKNSILNSTLTDKIVPICIGLKLGLAIPLEKGVKRSIFDGFR